MGQQDDDLDDTKSEAQVNTDPPPQHQDAGVECTCPVEDATDKAASVADSELQCECEEDEDDADDDVRHASTECTNYVYVDCTNPDSDSIECGCGETIVKKCNCKDLIKPCTCSDQMEKKPKAETSKPSLPQIARCFCLPEDENPTEDEPEEDKPKYCSCEKSLEALKKLEEEVQIIKNMAALAVQRHSSTMVKEDRKVCKPKNQQRESDNTCPVQDQCEAEKLAAESKSTCKVREFCVTEGKPEESGCPAKEQCEAEKLASESKGSTCKVKELCIAEKANEDSKECPAREQCEAEKLAAESKSTCKVKEFCATGKIEGKPEDSEEPVECPAKEQCEADKLAAESKECKVKDLCVAAALGKDGQSVMKAEKSVSTCKVKEKCEAEKRNKRSGSKVTIEGDEGAEKKEDCKAKDFCQKKFDKARKKSNASMQTVNKKNKKKSLTDSEMETDPPRKSSTSGRKCSCKGPSPNKASQDNLNKDNICICGAQFEEFAIKPVEENKSKVSCIKKTPSCRCDDEELEKNHSRKPSQSSSKNLRQSKEDKDVKPCCSCPECDCGSDE